MSFGYDEYGYILAETQQPIYEFEMKNIFLLIFLIASFSAFCQKDTSKINFVANWSKGDVYKFKVTKINKEWRYGKLSRNAYDQYIARFEVIDSTAKSYKIKWRFKNNLRQVFKVSSPKLDNKYSKYDTTEVIYTTDEYGTFTGIENWKEVGQMVIDLIANMMQGIEDLPGKNRLESLKRRMNTIKASYQVKKNIEHVYFKEISILQYPFGVEYQRSDTVKYEDKIATVYPGKSIKAHIKIFCESVNSREKRCVLRQQLSVDPADAKKTIKGILKSLDTQDQAYKSFLNASILDVKGDNRYEYYYYPGIPIKVETKREALFKIGAGDAKAFEQIKIELIND